MNLAASGIEPHQIAQLHPSSTHKLTPLHKMLSTPLFLLPLLPFLTLLILTFFLRPSCHPLLPSPAAQHTCQVYHFLAVTLDITVLVGGLFALLIAWDSAAEPDVDLESAYAPRYSGDIEEEEREAWLVGASKTTSLLPRPYTFGVREVPLLCGYGTMLVDMEVDADTDAEVSALMGFYHFEGGEQQDLKWVSPRPYESPHGSYETICEDQVLDTERELETKLKLSSTEAGETSEGCDDAVSMGKWEAIEDENGWTRWRWRHSGGILSDSPEDFML